MQTFSSDERLALLLNVAGGMATEVALRNVPVQRAETIKRLIGEFKVDPPSEEEVQYVLQDFDRYFRFAMNHLKQTEEARQQKIKAQNAENAPLAPKITLFHQFAATEDPIADLSNLDPYQIATALREDQPKTIALILRQLDPELAGKTLEFLADDLRLQTFMIMGQPITVPTPIIRKVVRTAFDRANTIRQRRVDPELNDTLVEMVRSLPRETRRKLMGTLKEESPDMAEQIQEKLYRFEDLLRLDDRSIQSVLAKIQSDQLVMALTRADEQISQRLLNNMSKRARQSIEEEIGFNERATNEEIESARFDIAQTIATMDEAGEISL